MIQKGDLCPLRLLPLITEFCVYASSGYSTRKQLARGRFFEGLRNYMENKNKGNKSKIKPRDINCIMDKMDRDGENKIQRIYRCHSNYALSKLIVDNGLEDLWARENPDSSKFSRYIRSSDTRPRVDMVYTDNEIASNTKINYIMVSFTNYYNAISIDKLL